MRGGSCVRRGNPRYADTRAARIRRGLLPEWLALDARWCGTAVAASVLVGRSGSQRWSMLGIVLAGLVLMFVARFVLRSPFFQIRRETGGLEDAAEA